MTRPEALTVAIVGALDAHVNVRPVIAAPCASAATALSCAVCPTVAAAGFGLTVTDATVFAATVSGALPVFPSEIAVIVTEPFAIAVTRPLELTVANAGFEL